MLAPISEHGSMTNGIRTQQNRDCQGLQVGTAKIYLGSAVGSNKVSVAAFGADSRRGRHRPVFLLQRSFGAVLRNLLLFLATGFWLVLIR